MKRNDENYDEFQFPNFVMAMSDKDSDGVVNTLGLQDLKLVQIKAKT